MAKDDKTVVTVTVEQVQQMIAAAIAPLVKEERVREILAEVLPGVTSLVAATDTAAPTPPPLNPAWLEGLTFRGAEQKKETVDGRPKMVSTPFTRSLTLADVLIHLVDGDRCTIVAADGHKHVVAI